MNTFPRVSIVILNWNGLKDTVECLESLKKITYPNYKVIVVDNGSKNNEGLILKEKFGDYIYLIQNDKNYGFAEGNNIGIKYAIKNKTDYVLCLNNDTIVEPDFLYEMIKTAQINKDKKIGMVAAKILKYQTNQIDSLGIQITKSGLSFNIIETKNIKYLFVPYGAVALYSSKMLNDIKMNNDYFDNDFFCYEEELDLGFRGVLSGYNCILSPKSIVYHKGGASAVHLSNFHIYHNIRNTLFYIIKNFPTVLIIRYSIWMCLAQLGLGLLMLKRGKLKVFLKAYLDVIKNINKLRLKRKLIQAKRKIAISQLYKKITPQIFIWSYFSNAFKK